MTDWVTRIQQKIAGLDSLEEIRRQISGRIGFCSGCYDILQSGHAVFFEQCKQCCDVLVVVVGRDSSIKMLKGPNRPVNPERNRLYLVAAMQMVDYVILGEEKLGAGKIDWFEIARRLSPDVLILNDDDSGLVDKRQWCESHGVELALVSRVVPSFLTPTSTTEIIDKVKQHNL